MLVVLAERLQHIREYLEEHPYPFPVLSDMSREVSKEYGVYVRVNFESVHIARPSTFILDPEGIIRYIFVASVQTEYPDDSGIYAVMDAM